MSHLHVIKTKRCYLDAIQESDYENIKVLYLHKEVRTYLGGPRKEEDMREVFKDLLHPAENCLYWVVREKQTNEFMGVVSLDSHHNGTDIEVSYQFLPRWWGAGYATETVREVIHYAFDYLRLPRVIAETQMANMSSRKLLERLGMRLIDRYERFGAEQAVYAMEAKEYKI